MKTLLINFSLKSIEYWLTNLGAVPDIDNPYKMDFNIF